MPACRLNWKIRRYRIQRIGNGIYWVYGDFIPIQFIVTTQLSTEENLWLRSLTNSLKGKREVDELLDSYNMHHKNVLYESVMDIIVRANQEAFEEVSGMCKALEELIHDTIEKKVEERIEERTKRYERLNLLLAQSNRVADIVKAAEDKEYRQQLMEELGL